MGLLMSQVARFRGAQVKYVHGPLKIDKDLTDGIKRFEIENSVDLIRAIENEISTCDPGLISSSFLKERKDVMISMI